MEEKREENTRIPNTEYRIPEYRIPACLCMLGIALVLLLNYVHGRSAKAQQNGSAKQEAAALNHLAGSTSPYLLQHAHNPVDWYPWGPEALEKAKRENKPIFLSVGYSSCHWCHVMEREDFENAAIAKALNADFVCIKVDREERPDIDDQYQMAVQLITKSGGWPMSVWLTPDLKPFYAGTYYPAADFAPLLAKIVTYWKEQPDKIKESADQIATQMQTITDAMTRKATAAISPNVTDYALAVLLGEYDKTHGGFGSKPKFPEAPQLLFLLDQYRLKRRADLLPVLSTTLNSMACGGIFDQVGGGFHRYSTDEKWLIPHFEKMLYDQALLALVYLDAYEALKKPFYKQVAQRTLDFVLREMTDPATGGFYTSRDADSEGEEGKYYVWTLNQLQDVLGKAEGDRFAQTFGVQATGNFQDDRSVLHLTAPLSEAQQAVYAPALARLLTAREKRVAPTVDDKVVVSLNGLMIAAMARGYQVTGDPRYRTAAERSALLIAKTLSAPDDTLLHEARAGKAGAVPAFLEDYAFLTDGLITLYEATKDASWLRQAESASNQMTRLFWDKQGESGFLSNGPAGAPVAHRRDGADNATPSPNGVAAQDLLRLAALPAASGARPQPETARLRKEAAGTVEAFQPLLDRAPEDFPTLLVAYRMLHTSASNTR